MQREISSVGSHIARHLAQDQFLRASGYRDDGGAGRRWCWLLHVRARFTGKADDLQERAIAHSTWNWQQSSSAPVRVLSQFRDQRNPKSRQALPSRQLPSYLEMRSAMRNAVTTLRGPVPPNLREIRRRSHREPLPGLVRSAATQIGSSYATRVVGWEPAWQGARGSAPLLGRAGATI
jgi:hypothetical protein